MRKIKLWIETGYVGCDYEDEIEVEDDVTDEKLDEEARIFLFNNIEFGWSEEEQC
jgi:hypothetical protein|nr:MAG TPA: hypothetical protein [Bacteriophage sp.]